MHAWEGDPIQQPAVIMFILEKILKFQSTSFWIQKSPQIRYNLTLKGALDNFNIIPFPIFFQKQ